MTLLTRTDLVRAAVLRAYVRRHRRELGSTRYQDDPVGWIRDVLREHLWSKQVEVAEAVQHHRRVAVASAHDVGKSFVAARLIAWWVENKPDPFAVTTAPTAHQVKAILWRELHRAHRRGRLSGRLNLTEWWLGDELVAFGRKPADYDQAAFQGIHSLSTLVVMDEAAGIPADLWVAADTLTTNENSRILAIGNPDNPDSEFAKKFQPGSGWHTIYIDGLESPNFTEEGNRMPQYLRQLLLSRTWVEEKKLEWGEDSPLYVAKVRGRFPEQSVDSVVPLSWARACQEERNWQPEQLRPVELGVDVGAGGDETVVRERRGVKAGRVWRTKTTDPMEVVGLIVTAINLTGATSVKIDVIGIGWGIAGRLKELKGISHNAEVHGINVAQAAADLQQFPKLRDQIWWEIGREQCYDRRWDLSEVDDTTIAQLIAPRYRLDSMGRKKVEPKEDTRKRLGRSPDDADALLLAYYVPPAEHEPLMVW